MKALLTILFFTAFAAHSQTVIRQVSACYIPPYPVTVDSTQVCNTVASSSDADAQRFIDTAFICNTSAAAAVTILVQDFKNAGLWSGVLALYPFITDGNLQPREYQAAINLKNPANTNAAYRLTVDGGYEVYSSYTFFSTGKVNTHIVPSEVFASDKIAFTFYNVAPTVQALAFWGAYQSEEQNLRFDEQGDNFYYMDSYGATDGRLITNSAGGENIGLFMATKSNSFQGLLKNGNVFASKTPVTTTGAPTIPLFLSGTNSTGGGNFTASICAFALVSTGWTQAQAQAAATIINKFVTSKGVNTY